MSEERGEELEWAGGEHRFFLSVREIRILQEKTDCGPMFLFNKFNSATWLIDDLLHTIRLGLIGGGMNGTKARKLVEQTVEESGDFLSFVPLASTIIQISLVRPKEDEAEEDSGVDDEDVEKTVKGKLFSPTEKSVSAKS